MEPVAIQENRFEENTRRLQGLADGNGSVIVKPNWPSGGPELNQVNFFHDKELEFRHQLSWYNVQAEAMHRGFDNIPVVRFAFGRIAYLTALACGCEPIHTNGIISAHPLGPAEEVLSTFEYQPGIEERGLYPEIAKRIAEFQSRYGSLPMIPSDTQSPFDVATQIAETESLLLALYDSPELVHRFLDAITRMTKDYYDFEINLFNRPYGFNSDYPFPKGIHFSNDNAAFVSPKIYEEFAAPYIGRLSKQFDGVTLHCCMGYQQNLQVMSQVPGIIGFDPQPTHNDESVILDAVQGLGFWRIWDWEISQAEDAYERYKRYIDETAGVCGLMLEIGGPEKDKVIELAEKVALYAQKVRRR